ncbi:hypothetical protein POM88_036022 [Heracleum sosnowskyi]|uniref:Uncharacterized protein n=1 Tax=Heracleum sosnowskyi TaxID=360622 RepID=A0AAD8MC22_9APIA|nr:hypothetical protein POM88_036022 [Heracleum sosnowskyi]
MENPLLTREAEHLDMMNVDARFYPQIIIPFKSGKMVVPDSFYKRFGMVIPALITFELWNGEVYHGNYVADEKKVIGLIEIIGLKNLQKRDIMLFSYVGNGRFELVIFDKFKVEKSFAINEAQSDAEVEIRAELPLQLEQNDISLKLEENEMSQEQTADDVEDEIMNEVGINEQYACQSRGDHRCEA